MKLVELKDNWHLKNEKIGDIDVNVPGCVHTDLLEKGKIPNYYYRDNSKLVRWIEDMDWEYYCNFDAKPNKNAFLVFEGLDTYVDIYLNGEKIGSCDDMFISYEFPVSEYLKEKNNQLRVCFRSPVKEVEGRKKYPAAFTVERIHTRRIQCTYGWDWVDRFVTCGIFRPVYIKYADDMYLSDLYIRTENIDSFSAQLVVEAEFANYQIGSMVKIEISDSDNKLVYTDEFYSAEPYSVRAYDIANPQLWYPNGMGEQPLYTIKTTVGENVVERKFGIRTIKILQLPDLPGTEYFERSEKLSKERIGSISSHNKTYSGFKVIINDKEVLCKGANWVPCEPFPSAETPEKYDELIRLAKEMNLNFIRVWGGGIFENDYFYSACDKNGILIGHDFLMACGLYPEKEDWFISALQKEALYAVKKLRNHPCLAWWHGDNENAIKGDDLQKDYFGRDTAFKGIGPVIYKYDSLRRFLPSSPYGGEPYASATKGTTHSTCHCSYIFDYMDNEPCDDYKEFFNLLTARFISEEPAFGATSKSSMLKFLTEDDLFNDNTEYIMRYHTKSNPDFTKQVYDSVRDFAEKIFGKFTSGEDRFFKYEYMQYEWVRVTFENCRRNLGYCNGMVYWMFDDCWPAALGWSLIDYYCLPKSGFYGFKRCAKPVVASITKEEDNLVLYVSNDSQTATDITATVRLYSISNNNKLIKSYKLDLKTDAYSVAKAELSDKLDDDVFVVVDIESEINNDRAFYKNGNIHLSSSDYVDIVKKDADTITVKAKEYTHCVEFAGEYIFEDNYFTLLQGEEKTVKFRKSLNFADNKIELIAYTISKY